MKHLKRFINAVPWGVILVAGWPLLGVGLMGYGAFCIYPPAGFMTVGALILLDSFHASRTHRKQP